MPLPSKFARDLGDLRRGYPRTPGERVASHAAFADQCAQYLLNTKIGRPDAARYEFSPGIKRPESLTIWDETGNVVLEGPVRDLVDRLHQVKWPELYGLGGEKT